MPYLLKCQSCGKMFDSEEEQPEDAVTCPQCSVGSNMSDDWATLLTTEKSSLVKIGKSRNRGNKLSQIFFEKDLWAALGILLAFILICPLLGGLDAGERQGLRDIVKLVFLLVLVVAMFRRKRRSRSTDDEAIGEPPDATEVVFKKALNLEMSGDRDGAIVIYDELAGDLAGTPNGQYAANCAKRLRERQERNRDNRKYRILFGIALGIALVVSPLFLIFKTPTKTKKAIEAVEQGISAFMGGKSDLAISCFTEAIRLDPKCVPAYCTRSLIYAVKGDHDKAMADCTEAIRLDPKSTHAYLARGGVYESEGDHDKAIADLTEAIRLDPKHAPAYYSRGVAYGEKGEQSKAETDFAEAKRLGFPGKYKGALDAMLPAGAIESF